MYLPENYLKLQFLRHILGKSPHDYGSTMILSSARVSLKRRADFCNLRSNSCG